MFIMIMLLQYNINYNLISIMVEVSFTLYGDFHYNIIPVEIHITM